MFDHLSPDSHIKLLKNLSQYTETFFCAKKKNYLQSQ